MKLTRLLSVFMLLLPAILPAGGPDIDSTLRISVTPTVYYQTERTEKASIIPFDKLYRYESIPFFAELLWAGSVGRTSFLASLPLRQTYLSSQDYNWGTNFPYRLLDTDTAFPYKGYISGDYDRFSFFFGRDVPDIGPGYWSSMTINKQAPYFDYGSVSFKIGRFTFSEYLINLDPRLLTDVERCRQEEDAAYNNLEPTEYSDRYKTVVIHDFGFSISDRLDLHIGESLIIGGRPPYLSNLNPFLFFHNFYTEDSANVFLFLNATVRIGNKGSLYTEISIDDIIGPMEAAVETAPPHAIGVLFGGDFTFVNNKALTIRNITEGAYVTPSFGIRTKPLQAPWSRIFYIDNYFGGYRFYGDYPLAFYMGNDIIDLRTLFLVSIPGADFQVDYHFLIKGEGTLKDNPNEGWPEGWRPTGIPEYRHSFRLEASVSLTDELSVAAGGEIIYKWNDSHAAGSEGFQWYGFAGVSWKGEFCLAGDK